MTPTPLPQSRRPQSTASMFRPRRRSLLGGGALAVGAVLGLSSCDNIGEIGGGSTGALAANVPLTLTPFTTEGSLVSPDPALTGFRGVMVGDTDVPAALATLEQALELRVAVVRGGSEEVTDLPVDPTTIGTTIDESPERVRVYARRVVEDQHVVTMHTSTTLDDWDSLDLEGEHLHHLSAAGDGLLVLGKYGNQARVIEVADDGALSELTPVPIPEAQEWTISAVARIEQTIALLVDVVSATEASAPYTVTSTDGGSTWAEAVALPTTGSSTAAASLLVVGAELLVTGTHVQSPEGNEDLRFTRPVAWVSSDGATFAQEDVPLPTFGLDGWTYDYPGEVSADTPVDFLRVSAGTPVRSSNGEDMHLAVAFYDDCRVATRSSGGEWSVTDVEEGVYASDAMENAVAAPGGAVVRTRTTLDQRATGDDFVSVLDVVPPLDLDSDRAGSLGPLPAMVTTSGWRLRRSENTLNLVEIFDNRGVVIEGDRLVEGGGLDTTLAAERYVWLCCPTPEVTFVLSRPMEEGNSVGLRGEVLLADEDWQEIHGVPEDGHLAVGDVFWDGEQYLLPISTEQDDQDGEYILDARVFTSTDGVTWVDSEDEVDFSGIPEGLAAQGGYITDLGATDGLLIGVGWVRSADRERRAATFVQSDTTWTAQIVDEDAPGVYLTQVVTASGGLLALGESDGPDIIHVAIGADGTASESYRASDAEQRALPLDLGGGALLAWGLLDHAADAPGGDEVQVGVGSCLWASADGGETWGATMIPGQNGRSCDIGLLRDGDDVVAFVEDPETPHAYRIAGARAQILGEGAVSDGG